MNVLSIYLNGFSSPLNFPVFFLFYETALLFYDVQTFWKEATMLKKIQVCDFYGAAYTYSVGQEY